MIDYSYQLERIQLIDLNWSADYYKQLASPVECELLAEQLRVFSAECPITNIHINV